MYKCKSQKEKAEKCGKAMYKCKVTRNGMHV
ncbi:hypothetical protein J2S16_004814 [Cytobacillus kochii]|nr:hypothetical protein [Cytobacillus kochii]